MMLVVGTEDSAFSAIESDAKCYRDAGHSVQFVAVPRMAHRWSTGHNNDMWSFLSRHSKRDRE